MNLVELQLKIYMLLEIVLLYNNIVTGQDSYVPLATGANKLGRIVGENLAGANNSFQGSLGSSCIKVMDMEAASTGMTEVTSSKARYKL